MYDQHWNLRETPFRSQPGAAAFFQSPTHDEALARLHFLAGQARRLGLLLGVPGCGKSLLLEVFQAELERSGSDVARVDLCGLTPGELWWQVAAELGLNPSPSTDTFPLWRQVVDHLDGNCYQRQGTVLLLDDADQAGPGALEHVLRLAQFHRGAAARFTMVLAADPAEQDRLGRRLLEMTELRIDIEPWDAADTARYVATALERAGAGESAIFSEAAVLRLHELARGIPRRINQLADLALLAGAGQDLTQIDADTVERVYEELGRHSLDKRRRLAEVRRVGHQSARRL